VVQQRGSAGQAQQKSATAKHADTALEREADRVGRMVASGGSVVGLVQGRSAAGAIQAFESDEHREIGDDATRGTRGEIRTVQLADDYRITYGEMVAMAGDYFTSLGEMRSLAAVAGTGAGTREEIEYVRVVKVHGKEELESRYSESARKAANERYYQLAASNRSHFLNPNEGDAGRSTRDKTGNTAWEGWRQLETSEPGGAVEYYRRYHVQALVEAFECGRTGASIDIAMAVEAFGGHYLTDMFAGGHVRTARGSISEYWDPKVPLFFHNFKGFMAERLAKYINEHNTWLGLLTIPFLFEQTLDTLDEKLAEKGMPDFTFGDLVAGSVHDYDNRKGVGVEVGGQNKILFGDGSLHEGDTKDCAVRAVQAGVAEVERAYEIAKAGGDEAAVLGELYRDGLFAPERLIPVVKPDQDQASGRASLPWKADSASALVKDARFQEGLKIFLDEKRRELVDIGNELDAEYKREAFQNGVVARLESAPIQTILDVINWTPDLGPGATGDADAKAREYLDTARQKGALGTLTWYQRHNLMVDLLRGPTVGKDEDAIMEILETAPDSDARSLIQTFGWSRLHGEIDDGWGNAFAKRFPRSTYG
jgi:hypothetical protein